MSFISKILTAAAAVLSLAIGSIAASDAKASVVEPSVFSFTGALQSSSDTVSFEFMVNVVPSYITLRTFQFGGGVQGDNNTVAAGGFDPYLTLFDSVGNIIAANDDIDFDNGLFDSLIQYTITTVGKYRLEMKVSDKVQSAGSYFAGIAVCDSGQQCSGFASQFQSNWALDITGNVVKPTVIPTPIPAGLPLLLGGLAAFGLMRRRAKA
jgi:hypothetical protein